MLCLLKLQFCIQIYVSEPANVSSLEAIKSSLFVLSLDQISNVESYNDQSTSGMQLIHGCGSKSNGGNRWFDKTIQVDLNYFI